MSWSNERAIPSESQLPELCPECVNDIGQCNCAKRYVKRPVVIEAVHYNGLIGPVRSFVTSECLKYNPVTREYSITTPEGDLVICKGDYIIKGVKGEFYPCKEDIFNMTYDMMKEEY